MKSGLKLLSEIKILGQYGEFFSYEEYQSLKKVNTFHNLKEFLIKTEIFESSTIEQFKSFNNELQLANLLIEMKSSNQDSSGSSLLDYLLNNMELGNTL